QPFLLPLVHRITRQEFHRSQLIRTWEPWAKESYEIATKIAYLNGGLIGAPRDRNKDCQTLAAVPVLPNGYVINANRVADRRVILGGDRVGGLFKSGSMG